MKKPRKTGDPMQAHSLHRSLLIAAMLVATILMRVEQSRADVVFDLAFSTTDVTVPEDGNNPKYVIFEFANNGLPTGSTDIITGWIIGPTTFVSGDPSDVPTSIYTIVPSPPPSYLQTPLVAGGPDVGIQVSFTVNDPDQGDDQGTITFPLTVSWQNVNDPQDSGEISPVATITIYDVPEPRTFSLILYGMAALGISIRRRTTRI